MKRREFIRNAIIGLGTTAVAAPVLAQSQQIKWRLASSFPKGLDTFFGAAETVAKRVAVATGGKFQIQIFAAGEIISSSAVLDAVKDGKVEMGHSAGSYYFGKDPTFTFDTGIPFGLTNRQQDAWYRFGNGLKLMRELYGEQNVHNIPCGNTGAQMGGWYRKEINTPDDFKGLKMRCGGFPGRVLSKFGVVPQPLPASEIYSALEKGTLDAAEWVGPYDDQRLGLNRVCKFYYYPGWWDGSAQISIYINSKKWAELPLEYQAILEMACADAHVEMMAAYDAKNAVALKQFLESGTQLRVFSEEIMDVAYKFTKELCEEFAAKNPKFKKVYEDFQQFRDGQFQWFRVAELAFQNYAFTKVGTR